MNRALYLFMILLAVIILSDLGFKMREGLSVSSQQIPRGEEDKYILKSSIVPPVCPKCPSSAVCPRNKPCPPCPACARCPEPAFTCKKVPDYSAARVDDKLPLPMLNSFSQFNNLTNI
jgi:hypothetical protein